MAAPIVVTEPRQIDRFGPVIAAGDGLTATTTLFEFEHPVAVIVSTKV